MLYFNATHYNATGKRAVSALGDRPFVGGRGAEDATTDGTNGGRPG